MDRNFERVTNTPRPKKESIIQGIDRIGAQRCVKFRPFVDKISRARADVAKYPNSPVPETLF